MIPAVDCLGCILRDKIFGCMTIIAHSDGLMARMVPRSKLFTHDMAIGAGIGVIGEVTEAVPVVENECRQAYGNAD